MLHAKMHNPTFSNTYDMIHKCLVCSQKTLGQPALFTA